MLKNKICFVILNPENNSTALKKTMRSISDYFPDCPTLCVLRKNKEIAENTVHSNVVLSGNTIAEMLDTGIKNSPKEWCFIIIAGTPLRHYSLRKYECFLKDKKDILFPVVDRKWTFDEATINGILIHKDSLEDGFGKENNLKIAKLLWATRAIELKYRLISIVGARLI